MYPVAEVGHLLGLALLIGTAGAFDLRLLGRARTLPVEGVAAFLLPLARVGLALAAATGTLLFAANATTLLTAVFAVKLIAIAAGVLNATVFDRGVFRSVAGWSRDAPAPAAARRAAVISLISWVVALTCGRLLAYL